MRSASRIITKSPLALPKPSLNLFAWHMVGSVNAKEVRSVIVTNVKLSILWDVDSFGAQPRFVLQNRIKIRGLRLEPQTFDAIAIGLVMNKQPDLILSRWSLDLRKRMMFPRIVRRYIKKPYIR